jgi:hypothetical protein
MGLLGALIYNFGALQKGASLDEGARQFEALVRFAGANAANTGRAVQFRFEADSTNDVASVGPQLRVMREVDPVAQPGVFEDAREADPFLTELLERIRFVDVRGGERPANQSTNEIAAFTDESSMGNAMPPITFYPDGSSDSAAIVIASRDLEDLRQMTIHLAGVTGGIRAEINSQDEMPAQTTADKPLETPERLNDFETTSTNDFPDEFPEP